MAPSVRLLPVLLIASLLAGAAGGQQPGAAGGERGALAPAGRWTQSGGCPAGTGASRSAPLRTEPALAWSVRLPGTIEGEPLVWDERVLVATRKDPGKRVLYTLDLLNGQSLAAPYSVRSALPLEPAIHGRTVVVREDDDAIRELLWGTQRLYSRERRTLVAPVSAPTVLDRELYVASGDALLRCELGESRPVWSVAGSFRGRPALRGQSVYALRIPSDRVAELVELDRRDGSVRRSLPFAQAPLAPAAHDAVRIGVYHAAITVRSDPPFRVSGGRSMRVVVLPRPLPDGFRVPFLMGSGSLVQEPAAWEAGFLGHLDSADDGTMLVLNPDPASQRAVALADPRNHSEYLAGMPAPSVAGDLAYLGGSAVLPESGRILWRLDRNPSERPVPARETLLLVEGGDRVLAYRPATRHEAPSARAAPPARTRVAAGTVVLRDGSRRAGAVELDAGAGRVTLDGGRRDEDVLPLDAVLAVEDARGALLYAATAGGYFRALRNLLDGELAQAYAGLAEDARTTNDLGLIRRLWGEASARGAGDKTIEGRVLDAIERLQERELTTSLAKVRAILEQERALEGHAPSFYWTRYQALPAGAATPFRTGLLRRVLEHDPAQRGALEAVRELVPAGLAAAGLAAAGLATAGPGEALDWLDLVDATAQCPVEVVRVPDPAGSLASLDRDQQRLGQARQRWRPDLVALRSEHLLILSPAGRPGALAQCLSYGELVCEALDAIFSGGPHRAARQERLLLHLFPTQQEYLAQSAAKREHGAGLDWSAGHYDAVDNVSRIYWPDGDGRLRQVQRTYAHEITHHWLQQRCPLVPDSRHRLVRAEQPGYWIVEGFASMVEDFVFDTGSRAWSTENRFAERLDQAASTADGERLSWSQLTRMSQKDFLRMRRVEVAPLTLFWVLGRRRVMDSHGLFYAQSAALCQYLFHAEDGRWRAQLLDYAGRYYANRDEGLDFAESFGMPPALAGKSAITFARERIRGSDAPRHNRADE